MIVRLFALVVALVAPHAASGADLPVNYLAQEKPLKSVAVGTPLAFQLYSDESCSSLVHAVSIPIEQITLRAKVAQLPVKKSPKPPNTVELRTTIDDVDATPSLYLKVSGAGVVAVGRECQAQGAAIAGPAGPTGPRGATGGLTLLDSAGATVGSYGYNAAGFDEHVVYIQAPQGAALSGFAFLTAGDTFLELHHADVDCAGPGLLETRSPDRARYIGEVRGRRGVDVLYLAPGEVSEQLMQSRSFGPISAASCTGQGGVVLPPDRCCCSTPGCRQASFNNVGPLHTMPFGPFVAPFRVNVGE